MPQNQQKPTKIAKTSSDFARYSGMAFQMAAIMLIACLAGFKLDTYLHSSPAFIIIFLLAGVAGAMYVVIKSVSR